VSALIGTSPLRIGYDQTPNKIIARKGLGMRAKNINGELRSTVAKQEAMATTAQQAKELKALTATALAATLKEQASQIQKVSDRLEHLKPTKRDLMISKIISGAACLAELTSNPKSFYNCPDLHGGVPGFQNENRNFSSRY
jgi:hypothetical protein